MTAEALQTIDVARPALLLRRMWLGARLNYILPLIVLALLRGPLQPNFDRGVAEAVGTLNMINLINLMWLPFLVYISGARSRFAAALAMIIYAIISSTYLFAILSGVAQHHHGVVAVAAILALVALFGAASSWPILFSRIHRNPLGPLALAQYEREINHLPFWWRATRVTAFFALALTWMILLMAVLAAPMQYQEYVRRANRQLARDGTPNAVPEVHEIFQYFAGGSLFAVAIGLVATVLMVIVVRYARRWLLARAESRAAQSVQDPILLLRSFADDEAKVRPNGLLLRLQFRKRRLEEVVASIISPLGTFIGIGAPNERLPQLGAERAYFDDDTWQDAILHWIGISRYVVMIAGLTEWVQWELRTLIERSGLNRLIILIPPAERDITERRLILIRDCFSRTAWEEALGELDIDRVTAILFTKGGRVQVINGAHRDEIEYRLGTLAAIRQLESAETKAKA